MKMDDCYRLCWKLPAALAHLPNRNHRVDLVHLCQTCDVFYFSLWHTGTFDLFDNGFPGAVVCDFLFWTQIRVWKGILGIRDLNKIRCGIRENEKYLDGIRDLIATREAGFAKIWARDAGFCCLSVGNSAKANQPGEHKISMKRANLHLKFISFCRN